MKTLYKILFLHFFIITSVIKINAQIANPPAYDVLELSIKCDGKNTSLFIETTRKPSGKAFNLTNPLRFVIDLDNAILKSPVKNIPNLPEGLFTKVALSQFKGGNNPVVRIVFYTVAKSEKFDVNMIDTGFGIKIPTTGYPKFSFPDSTKPIQPQEKSEPAQQPQTKPAETVVSDTTKPISSKTDSIPPPTGEAKKIYIRKILKFTYDDRDPFLPESPVKEVPFGSIVYANVEALSLVGIVKEGEKFKALLEDNQGFGYLLGVGDSVENGNVKVVSDTSIVFAVEELGGWTRMSTLVLLKETKQKGKKK